MPGQCPGHSRTQVRNQWIGMKQTAWPPAGLWHHEEPQLNFGWNCAVNNLLARNCLLIGRKRISVIAEVLSLCVPDAGSKIKKKKTTVLPWILTPLDNQEPTQYLSFSPVLPFPFNSMCCHPQGLFRMPLFYSLNTLSWGSDTLKQVQRAGALCY